MSRHNRTTTAMLAASVALTLACDDTTGPRSEPFTASFNATQVAAPGGRCPALTVSISGPGTATPGGALTTSQSHCINPQGSTPLAFTDGRFTFTFAGGSTLTGTYGGVLVPTSTLNVFTIDGDAVFTGGTGEFASARGNAEATGTLNIQTGDASVGTLTGTITR